MATDKLQLKIKVERENHKTDISVFNDYKHQKHFQLLQEFINYMAKEIGLQTPVKSIFVKELKCWNPEAPHIIRKLPGYSVYFYGGGMFFVYINHRTIKDVLMSVGEMLIFHRTHEQGKIDLGDNPLALIEGIGYTNEFQLLHPEILTMYFNYSDE